MTISETVLAVFFLTRFEQKAGKNIAKKRKRHKLFRYIYISGNTFLLRYVQTRDPTVTLTRLSVFCVKWLRSGFEIYSHASCLCPLSYGEFIDTLRKSSFEK